MRVWIQRLLPKVAVLGLDTNNPLHALFSYNERGAFFEPPFVVLNIKTMAQMTNDPTLLHQIDAGVKGRKRGHSYENELASKINL